MGLSSRIRALNRIALGYQNAILFLQKWYELEQFSALHLAAWFIRVGIIEPIVQENLQSHPDYKVCVKQYGRLINKAILDIFYETCGELKSICADLDDDDSLFIEGILQKQEAFYDVDSQIPKDLKRIMDKP